MSVKIRTLSKLLNGKTTGDRIPSVVDIAIIEAVLELAGLSDSDVGIQEDDFTRQADNVNLKVDGDP
jgi:hypothetical protein